MPRLDEVSRVDLVSERVIETYQKHFGDKDPVEEPGSLSGTPGNWWTVFALDEHLFETMLDRHAWQFSTERKLDPTLRELALARTGWVANSSFVFTQHSKLLRSLGFATDKVSSIPAWSSLTTWTSQERLVLAYTDSLVAGGGRVPDDLFASVRAEFSDVEILELTYMVTTYVQSSTICRALRLEFDDIPDPVTDKLPSSS